MILTQFSRHIRSFALKFLLGLLSLASISSYALSLGELTVNSVVGERFFAVAPISDVKRRDVNSILVSLAPRSVYQRMGVDFEYFHTGFVFDVLIDERDQVYLRVVSKDVVFEPYIDFVLSVRWPGGFLSEQYTALLDMPLPPAEPEANSSSLSSVPISAAPKASPPGAYSGSVSTTAETPAELPGFATTTPENQTPVDVEKLEKATTPPVVITPVEPTIPSIAQPVELEATDAPADVTTEQAEQLAVEPAEPQSFSPNVESVTEGVDESTETAVETIVKDAVTELDAATELEQPDLTTAQSAVETDTVDNEATTEARQSLDEIVPESVNEVVEQAFVDNAVENEGASDDNQQIAAVIDVDQEGQSESGTEAGQGTKSVVETYSEQTTSVEDTFLAADAEKIAGNDELHSTVLVAQDKEANSASSNVGPNDDNEAPLEVETEPKWQLTSQSGDTLWELARKIKGQSGGRLIDIVNALHSNNQGAFIRGDANLLRVDRQLSLTARQLYAQTPAKYRDSLDEWNPDGGGEQAAVSIEKEAMGNQDGVLSLVAQGSLGASSEVSDLTSALSEQNREVTETVDSQLAKTAERADEVESRVDELIDAYKSLAEKTEQLKAIEKSLDEELAKDELANEEIAGVPVSLPELATEKGLDTQNAPAENRWPTAVVLILALIIIVLAAYWLSTLLRSRRFVQQSTRIDREWDNELFDQEMPVDDELASVVELRGENALIMQQKRQAAGAETGGMIEEHPSEGAAELQVSLYIAYERYKEAEKLVFEELEKDPGNLALKSLLLEVYAATEQTDAFERLAAELVELDAGSFEDKVLALRG